VESQHPNHDLEIKYQTMNRLQKERFRCEERNIYEQKPDSEYDIVYLHYVNEQNLGSCTQVKFLIGAHKYVVLDTGCEASIMSEQLYKELKSNGADSLELPTQNFVLVGAFSRKAQRVRKHEYLTLKFGDVFLDQIFLVSEQLLTPMLSGNNFCIANGIVLDFQRGKLVLQNDGESTEIEIMNRREGARRVENCYESLSNRQVIALPTPLTEPCQLAMVKLPHPLNLASCEVCPSFSEHDRLRKEGNKGAFHIMCPSSGEADVEVNCSSKD
jgi:hypothetical protein